MLHVLRDNLGKADAFITAAEELIGRPGGGIASEHVDDDEADLRRRRNHLAHLLDSAKMAVRAAGYGAEELGKHGQGG